MICLTGDVHHMSLRINEQGFIDKGDSEVRIAARYLRLVEEAGVKVTLYVTGRTLAEEWEDFRPIAASPLVEIGGHTYAGLPRSPWSALRARLTGRPTISHSFTHGSYARQLRDVRRLLEVVRRRTGREVPSWRSHGLVRDRHTEPILARCGVRCISDELAWDKLLPERTPAGLVSHPLNVIMDHDHLYHAHRTLEYVRRQQQHWTLAQDPTRESYGIEEWGERVMRQVSAIEARGGIATVLMHPLCMFTADGFYTARRLLAFFARSRCLWASETAGFVPAGFAPAGTKEDSRGA
jgi:peptidoglycan/xylan/chitin deacetylase (PgdA/CDA1 family)